MLSMKRLSIFSVVLAFLCCAQAKAGQSDQSNTQETLSELVNEGWHVSPPLTVHAIETREQEKSKVFHKQHPNRNDVLVVPFGFQNEEWNRFKVAIKPGDEVRFVSAPTKDWQHLAGREGYILIRQERIMRFLVTREN